MRKTFGRCRILDHVNSAFSFSFSFIHLPCYTRFHVQPVYFISFHSSVVLHCLQTFINFFGGKEFLISKQKFGYLNMLNNRWPFYLSIDLFTRFFNFPIFESILIDSSSFRFTIVYCCISVWVQKTPRKKSEHHFKWQVSASIDKKLCIYECRIDWHRFEVDRHSILFFILLLVVFVLFFQRILRMKICVCETKTFTR